VEEHVAVLQLMLSDRNAFNASESSVEWQNVHRAMCENFYLQSRGVPRSSVTLHGHVVEMYGALKKALGICLYYLGPLSVQNHTFLLQIQRYLSMQTTSTNCLSQTKSTCQRAGGVLQLSPCYWHFTLSIHLSLQLRAVPGVA
jgi:hypothetical protein